MGFMKVLIYIKKEDVISGNITEYRTQIKNLGYEDYVQVSITADEFARLEDRIEFISEEEMDNLEDGITGLGERDEEWLKDQYNRNRSIEDHLK